MGNKQGSNAASGEGDGAKRRKKEAKKEDDGQKSKRLEKKSKKKDGKRKRGKQDAEFDLDESSHVTGDDSESGVFHSAENVSVSPYLNSCTLSELEQMGRTSAGTSSWASSSGGSRLNYEHHHQFQHPKILSSSRDFRDGFSLEACIPPEIARPERYNPPIGREIAEEEGELTQSGVSATSATARLDRSKDGSGKSRRSNASSGGSGSRHVTPTSARAKRDISSAAAAEGDGFSTPLLSTPVFSRAQRDRHSPKYTPCTDPDSSLDISASPSKSSVSSYNIFNHPFFHKGSHKKDRQQPQTDQKETSKQLKDQPQHYHPHHQQLVADYKNLPKPTSPHPQRRALSPKMTSSPIKLISSDDSSSSPTTPTPQRRAANLLNLLRPGGSKKGKGKSSSEKEPVSHKRLKHLASDQSKDWRGTGDIDTETSTLSRDSSEKRKPRWKTWERSSKPKKTSEKAKRVSIFGTSRKSGSGKNKKERRSSQGVDVVRPSSAAELSSRDRTSSSRSTPSSGTLMEIAETKKAKQQQFSTSATTSEGVEPKPLKNSEKEQPTPPYSTSSLSRRIQQAAACGQGGRHSNRSSNSNLDSRTITPSASQGMSASGGLNRASSSPPTIKSAAFCIMRLEELERAIEKTIREKFPDAEPFILRKPTFAARDEETKGSRSLPTTPSLKKKRYLARDDKEVDSNGSSRHSRNGDATGSNGEGSNGVESLRKTACGAKTSKLNTDNNQQSTNLKTPSSVRENTKCVISKTYDVAYESVPSPTMSPVILRRFGARARHASISPKVPRAKTAALYNSPSEVPRVEEPSPPTTPTPVAATAASSDRKPLGLMADTANVLRKISLPAAFPRVTPTERHSGADGAMLGSGLIGSHVCPGSGSHTDVASGELVPLSMSQKSNSKYDNVMDDEEIPHYASVIKASGKTQKAYVTRESDRSRVAPPTASKPSLLSSPRLVRQARLDEAKYDNVSKNRNKQGSPIKTQSDQSRRFAVDTASKTHSQFVTKNSEINDENRKVTEGGIERPVIVPSTSAVFGSVSPKLKRHLQAKSQEQKLSDSQKQATLVNIYPATQESCDSKTLQTATTTEDPKSRSKQLPIKSLSLDSPTQSRHFEENSDSLFARPCVTVGASPTNASPTLGTSVGVMSPSRPSSSSSASAHSPGGGGMSTKPSVEATSALSVRERIRSLNKSASEGWSVPVSPMSPPVAQQSSSPLSPMLGPQPYPHFTPDWSGGRHTAGSTGGVKQLSLRNRNSSLTSPPAIHPPNLSQRPQYLSPHQQSSIPASSLSKHRPGLGAESAISTGPVSPGPGRKHSTDHVVFGSAVALPCRVYAQVTSPTHPHSSQFTFPTHQQSKQVTSPTSPHLIAASPFVSAPSQPRSPTLLSPAPRVQLDKKRVHLVKESSSSSAHVRHAEPRREASGERYARRGDRVQDFGRDQGLCRNVEVREEKRPEDHTAGEVSARVLAEFNTPGTVQSPAQHQQTVPTDSVKLEKTDLELVGSQGRTFQNVNTSKITKPGSLSITSAPSQLSEAGVTVLTSSACGGFPTVIKTSSRGQDQQTEQPDSSFNSGNEDRNLHPLDLELFSESDPPLSDGTGTKSSKDSDRVVKGQKVSPSKLDNEQSKHKVSLSSFSKTKELKLPPRASEDDKKHRQETQQKEPKEQCIESTRQENVESPDVYKPSLRYVEPEAKPAQRQPLSKVISDMISVSSQAVHPSLPTREAEQSHPQQHERQKQQQQQQQPQRQRRRRQQPPEHHQQKLNLVFENQTQPEIEPTESQHQNKQSKSFVLTDQGKITHNKGQQKQAQQVAEISHQAISQVSEASGASAKEENLVEAAHTLGDVMGVEAALSKKDPSTTLTSQPQSVVRQVKCESKEMQTDIVTKADKGVDSWTPPRIDPALVLKRDMATGEKGRLPRTRQASDQRSVSEDTPPGEELDKDFLEKVKSTQVSTSCSYATQRFAQVEKSDAAVPRIKDESSKLNTNKDRGVPPPSPTAMERLMQEMDEEDSDEEEQERKEIEQAMRRETEMKEFTHKIYKRLSDLLYSHSGDEEEEDDCKEEDDEDGKTNVATGGVIVKEDDEVFEGCANPSPRAKHTRDHPLELERPESLLTTDEDKVRSPSYNTGDSLRTTDYDSLENKSILARGIVVNASGRVGSPLEFSDDEPYPKPDYRPIVTSRVLTIESSSSLTTTTESESEVEETPVIIFKPPPAEQTTELRRLRDYREDPELPTLLRNAIISRNMGGAGLWEDEDRNKSRSPVAEEVFERKAAPTVFVFPERSVDFEQEQQTKSFDDARELDKAESAIPRGDFRKQQQPQLSYQQRRSSREYHSDDDVVAGRGVPEYYDDSTLWVSRRQQRPPVQFSQLSLAVVAQRRRERRERWLKKRRRNRTDLVSSTGGSSDTDRDHRSEVTGQQQGGPRQASQHQAPHAGAVVRRIPAHDRRHFLSGSSLDAYEDYPEDKEQGDGRNPHDMGSGILASPKYAKPIVLSFLGGNIPTATARDSGVTATDTNQDKRFAGYTRESEAKALGSSEIPGIEETFNELKSVQNILEGLQDRKGASGAKSASETVSKGKPPIPNPSLLSPLTSENLRSLRSYDKSGSSRRSRMSLTDRTESDLDLYSERGCDDENSSGSEYADDEGEGDNGEDEETCYNTAEDDLDTGTGASRRPASGLTISDTSASRRSGNLSDESESTDFVVSCTFYNSNVSPPDLANTTTGTSAASAHSAAAPPFSGHAGSGTTSTSVSSSDPLMAVSATSSVTSHTPVAGPPAPHVFSHGQGHNSGLHSGGAASSNSRHIYHLQGHQVQQQTADVAGFALPGFASPSAPRYPQRSTFQSARNQMQDIQTHLQALRRQMEVLPDDDDSGDVTDRTMSSSYPGPDISTE